MKKVLTMLLALVAVSTMSIGAMAQTEEAAEETAEVVEIAAEETTEEEPTEEPVAKVGDVEYASIDEAIAAWTNGKTLTLLADVQLSDVIKLSSTEYHILDLGTYTMTAASKKDAIQIVNNGRSSASWTLDIKADATNPGGITATGKAIVRTAGKSGVKDRPIIRFYNGIFNASYIVYHSGSNGTNCPQFQFNGGEFNGTVYTNRTLNQFYGGTFNGSLMMSVDSSAYALISGGTFKQLSNLYMSALNKDKFTIGSAKGVFDREVYVNEDGYYVVSETPSQKIEAEIEVTYGTNDYFHYSKAQTENKLKYENADLALSAATKGLITLYVDSDGGLTVKDNCTLNLDDAEYSGEVTIKSGKTFTVINPANFNGTVTPAANQVLVITEDEEKNEVTYKSTNVDNDSVVAGVVDKETEEILYFEKIETAVSFADDGDTVCVLSSVDDTVLRIKKSIIITGESAEAVLADESTSIVFNNVETIIENNDVELVLDKITFTGYSYVDANNGKALTVTNCNADVAPKKLTSRAAFIVLGKSELNNQPLKLTVKNNTILSAQAGTDFYSTAIFGWRYIADESVISNNIMGSSTAPYNFVAIKLMNAMDGATVEIKDNTIYGTNEDWYYYAVDLYQNNSRENNYRVLSSGNNFITTVVENDYTAYSFLLEGNPYGGKSGTNVILADLAEKPSTVNGRKIALSDIDNSELDSLYNKYYGINAEYNENNELIGGTFIFAGDAADFIAEGYTTIANPAGGFDVVSENLVVEEIKVKFVDVTANDAEGEKLYNINLVGADEDIINRLNSGDLTFVLTVDDGDIAYEIIDIPNDKIAVNSVDNSENRYEFHFETKTDVETDTGNSITIAQVRFTGYGQFDFAVDTSANNTNAIHATTIYDNIVDTFVPDGSTLTPAVGDLDVSDKTVTDIIIVVPTRSLTINLSFPNAIEDRVAAYQQMKVTVSGGDLDEAIVVDLGSDAEMPIIATSVKPDAAVAVTADSVYQVVLTNVLTANVAYNVEVSGAGYRTARYTVTMQGEHKDGKTLNFWNNVKDNAIEVEEDKPSSAKNVTFLAGDIVKDSIINIYDLSAVVSYFGEIDLSETNNKEYAKYDLNRDGKIDSKDVAYVLVSWGK